MRIIMLTQIHCGSWWIKSDCECFVLPANTYNVLLDQIYSRHNVRNLV